MKTQSNLLVTLLSLFFPFLLFGQDLKDGFTRYVYPDGKVSSEGTLRNGKPDGYWKTFYPNGALKSEGNRKEFKLDSIWTFYTDSGKVKSVLQYQMGKKEGIQTYFNDLGLKLSEEAFHEDQRQGFTRYFDEEGRLQKMIPFEFGVEEGIGREYAADGRIVAVIEYKKGYVVKEERINRKDRAGLNQGVWKEFYPDEVKVKSEGVYKDNKKQQKWTQYDEFGRVSREELYINGELVQKEEEKEAPKLDIQKTYYPGGKVKSSGTYNKGVPEGVFREYTADGKIYDAKIYKAGKLQRQGVLGEDGLEQGIWKEFYDSGNLKGTGNYVSGKKTGRWQYYYENGVLEQEGNYVQGKPDGLWNWYYPSKRLLREENYAKGKEEGLLKEYTDNDQASVDWNVLVEGSYSDGQKNGTWTYHTDELITRGNFTDGKEDGEWKQWYYEPGKEEKDMRLNFIGSYSGGDEQGLHRFFYPNGKPREERNYRSGVRDGVWKRWDVEGNLIITITYQDGKELRYDGFKVEEIKEDDSKKED